MVEENSSMLIRMPALGKHVNESRSLEESQTEISAEQWDVISTLKKEVTEKVMPNISKCITKHL